MGFNSSAVPAVFTHSFSPIFAEKLSNDEFRKVVNTKLTSLECRSIMAYEEARRRSFLDSRWPHDGEKSYLNMAEFGFFYIGQY